MTNTRLQREKEGSRIPVYYRGKKYPSLYDLGNSLGFSKNQIRGALTDNYRGEILGKDITHLLDSHFTGRCCYIAFDKKFFTLPEIGEHIGLSNDTIYNVFAKTKERFEFEKELLKKVQTEPFIYKGVEYESIRDFCSKLKTDYQTFWRRISVSKYSIEEALSKEIKTIIHNEISFRGNTFPNKRILYQHYGYFRTIEVSFREFFVGEDPLKIFDMYLDFLEENNLPLSDKIQSVVPMYFYNGEYYAKSRDFYSSIGINTVNFKNESYKFPEMSDEEVIRNMKVRTHKKTGEILFPNCTIDVNAHLVSVKKRFFKMVRERLST